MYRCPRPCPQGTRRAGGGTGFRPSWLAALLCCTSLAGVPGRANGQEADGPGLLVPDRVTVRGYNDFGGTGLLQSPSAYMQPSGTIAVGIGDVSPYTRFFVTVQALPWLEGTFRYTSVAGQPYNQYVLNKDYKDRSFDLKVRLHKEDETFPAVSVGLRDVGGTGLFSSEYIVLSRRHNNFEYSGGIAWGNMGARGNIPNPLAPLPYFGKDRINEAGTGQLGSDFFQGKRAGLFAGVEWFAPLDGLSLLAEYDGNDYGREFGRQTVKPPSLPVNFGVRYMPKDWLSIAAGLERGNTAMLRVSARFDYEAEHPVTPPSQPLPLPPPPSARPAAPATPVVPIEGSLRSAQVVRERTIQRLFDSMSEAGLIVEQVTVKGDVVTVDVRAGAAPAPTPGSLANAAKAVMTGGGFQVVDMVAFRAPARDGDSGPVYALSGNEILRSISLTGQPHLMAEPIPFSWRRSLLGADPGEDPGAALLGALEARGLQAREIQLQGARLDITLEPLSAPPREDDLEALLRLPALTRGLGVDNVKFEAEVAGQPWSLIGKTVAPADPLPARAAPATAIAGGPATPAPTGTDALTDKQLAAGVFEALRQQNLRGIALDLDAPDATVHVTQSTFNNPAIVVGRAARALALVLPPRFQRLTIVVSEDALAVAQATVLREDVHQLANDARTTDEVWRRATFAAALPPDSDALWNEDLYPRFTWGLRPAWRQHVGGGDRFYAWQLLVAVNAKLQLTPGLSLTGSINRDVMNTFDDLNNVPASNLPHVRSEIVKYFQASDTWINSLYGEYATTLRPGLHGRVYGGLMEEMYAGVGGEILYSPHDTPWAVGLEVTRARKRGYERALTLLDYAITTGHASLYYDWGYHGLSTAVHVGKYLAGDVGATFEISREFKSGAVIGAWATKTNVTAEQFGEGAFDKGIFVRMPLELFTGRASRSGLATAFRPLTKDGGQRLDLPGRLHDRLDGMSQERLQDRWGSFGE